MFKHVLIAKSSVPVQNALIFALKLNAADLFGLRTEQRPANLRKFPVEFARLVQSAAHLSVFAQMFGTKAYQQSQSSASIALCVVLPTARSADNNAARGLGRHSGQGSK